MASSGKRRDWKHTEHKGILIFFCIVFSLYAASLLFPLTWLLVRSFTDPNQFLYEPESFFPNPFYIENYTRMFMEFDFIPMTINTIILSTISPTLSILACCCISYAYSKFQFKAKGLVYFVALSVMVIPSVGTLGATYQLMQSLNLMGTLTGYIFMGAGAMGFNFLLISGQYVSVSNEYSEAAEIDGASKLRIFLQIITPQIMPTLTAMWLLAFIGIWNDYAGPYLFLKESYPTLSLGVKALLDQATQTQGTDYPMLFAGIITVAIPVIVIFFLFQKKILSISLGGGIKG